MPATAPLRFLIVDDHPLLRIGAQQMITSQWPDARTEEAETLAEALQAFRNNPPDVVLLDLHLPDADGIESATHMLRVAGQVPLLVISQGLESAYATRLLELGVKGFLPKDQAGKELIQALLRVLQGGRYVSRSLADHLVDLMGTGTAAAALPHEALSSQEFRVMQLIAAGHAPSHIAEVMHLSVKTVGSYRARIMGKTGWQSNAELVKYCLANGLTEA
jgi:two-component system, NarL family, invasion response regulator UvrY